MASGRGLVMTLLLLLIFGPLALSGQERFQELIDMQVEVGFDSFFRVGQWTPVRVALANNGESLAGRLVIRPETSGAVVGNAFSAGVDLPNGARKSATLYIQARSFPDVIRVELIDEAGDIRASKEAGLKDLRSSDQLYVVVSGPNSAVPSLSGAHIGGANAQQVHWQIHEIPDNGLALESLDMMLMIDINSGNLSGGQKQAIRHWLLSGGHLVLAGGPRAQATAAGLEDILPLRPEDSQSLDNITALAQFSGDDLSLLDKRAIVSVGSLHEDARVLVSQDGLPLLIRRKLGAGLVDFLAVDPTLEPLSSWENIGQMWMKTLASRAPYPAWVTGFTRPESGAEAVANLPGLDLLPPLQTLCLFLSLYILLIGPLNYLILSRIKRSGWGWITIPLVIIVFTGVAWTVGFSLRGTEIIVSRLSVAQSFNDSEEARVDQFVGLLSPRRATYSLDAPEGHFLSVAGATRPSAFFASSTIQTATEISQSSRFAARDFIIDGGIFANFAMAGYIPRPAIGGGFTLDFDVLESGRMTGAYYGAIVNDSDITLRDAVVLGQGLRYAIEEDIEPGDVLALDGEQLRADIADYPAQPNPLELHVSALDFASSSFSRGGRNMTLRQVQGERYLRSRAFLNVQTVAEKQAAREQAFLTSFALDSFDSTARGTGLYLLGWADSWPRDLEIGGASWSAIDTTLYIIELDVDINLPEAPATLPSEYFSWIALRRDGLSGNGTDDFNLYEGNAVEFLLSPLPGLAMDNVHAMDLEVDRSGGYAQSLDIQVYNRRTKEYDVFGYRDGDELHFSNPRQYLGANNEVRLRLEFDEGIGSARVRKIRVEQTGAYER